MSILRVILIFSPKSVKKSTGARKIPINLGENFMLVKVTRQCPNRYTFETTFKFTYGEPSTATRVHLRKWPVIWQIYSWGCTSHRCHSTPLFSSLSSTRSELLHCLLLRNAATDSYGRSSIHLARCDPSKARGRGNCTVRSLHQHSSPLKTLPHC